eukprot:scaffold2231_cov106-Isochrysis_galbana.AAC.1
MGPPMRANGIACAAAPTCEEASNQVITGANIVTDCFKVGGVPVGLDESAIAHWYWCDQKAA